MPVLFKEKVYPTGYAGGVIDLNSLQMLSIKVTIRFPYTVNGNNYDLKPLTVNLLTDIGLSPDAHAYVVKWGDNRPETDTISNSMSPFKHEHTYEPGTQPSKSMTYTINVYGDVFGKYWPFDKNVGTEPNGFSIHATSAGLSVPSKNLLQRIIRDRSIKDGSRISRGWFGTKLFYQREVRGSLSIFDIILDGSSNEVRLVNPLTVGMNNWEDIRTDMVIDWGDGSKTHFYDKKINSMVFNTGSKYIPTHTYKAATGSRFTIKVKSVEPVVPIGCKLDSMYGTFPEDMYIGNGMGLFRYTEGEKTEWRNKIFKHIGEVRYLGSSLLDKWKSTTNMDYMFKDWNKLVNIPDYFFKENILSVCKSYKETFRNTESLILCDEYLLGETNNIVEHTNFMFKGSGIRETIKLKNSNSLKTANGMYEESKVTKSYDFLVNVPSLTDASLLFSQSTIKEYDNTMLSNSPILRSANSIFYKSKITQILLNMKQWGYIEDLQQAYAYTPLIRIQNDIFGGDFAKNSPDKSLRMGYIFSNIGNENDYVDIDPNVFQGFQDKSVKLNSSQPAWFKNAHINKLPEGLLYNMFRESVGRFDLTEFFCGIKTNDEIEHNSIKYSIIPSLFKNSFGVKIINRMYADCFIGYLSIGSIPSDNVSDVVQLFGSTSFGCRFPERYFAGNLHITNWKQLFYNTTWRYPDIPIDYIIYTKSSTVQCDEMLSGKRSRILSYRVFHPSSTVTTVTASKIFDYTPSASHDFILGGRTHTCDNSIEIKPLIYTVVSKSNTKLRLFTNSNVVNGTAEYKLDELGSYSQVSLPAEIDIISGTNTVFIKSQVPVYIQNTSEYEVAYIGGEFPYNSQVRLPTNIFPREIDRFVFSICDHNFLHKQAMHLKYIGILHRDIFKYHHDVTSTRLLRQVGDISHGIYGLQPRIYQYMVGLQDLNTICDNYNRVISTLHIPHLTKQLNRAFIISYKNSGNVNDKWILTNVRVQRNAFDHSVTTPDLGKAQLHTETSDYIEFRLSGSTGTLKLNHLYNKPTYPITVKTLVKGEMRESEHVLNSEDDIISIDPNKEVFIKVYADALMWISNDNRDYITEIYGSMPRCNFRYALKDIAPNLKRVGELLFIYLENDAFYRTFYGLEHFEYFPGTLFWYNYNATNFEECFANCPKLFKVDDYIITDKNGDINCKNMFKNSGVKNVRKPIADDINGKVVIEGMFTGCKTDFWFNNKDIDSVMFKNIDIYGRSGISFSESNNQQTADNFCNIDPDNESLSNISYYNISSIPFKYFKYASQSIAGQNVLVKWNDMNNTYLPFLINISPYDKINGSIPANMVIYNERLRSCVRFVLGKVNKITDNIYYRCNDITSIGSVCQGANMNGTNIEYVLPFNMKAVSNAIEAFGNSRNVVIDDNFKLPKHVIVRAENMFKLSSCHVPYGFFDNINKEILYKSSDRYAYWTPNLKGIFVMAGGLVEETGIFRSYGDCLNPVNTTNIYSSSSLSTLQPDKVYEGCEHLEVLDYHFDRCSKLSILPKINHLTNVWSYQHMFERSNILDIPADYLYTTRSDRDIMIDYMFANNPELFFTEVWIDRRCPGHFSIDYSLNEVFSGIGDDPEIFGHISYDSEYEHRSRVYPFDTRVTWVQGIEVLQPNVSVKLEGLYTKDLVGFDPEKIYAVMWGDGTSAVVVRDGLLLEEKHITHTYANPGRYELRVMLRNDCCYLPTPESGESKIKTVDLPTSFKFGAITDIKNKGLYNMFGTGVEHVGKNLFDELTGVDTIEVYNDMFYSFRNLVDLEVGVLDCMPNLKTMKNFLYNSKGTVEITLKAGLLDKLTKLTDIENFAFRSNVKTVEPHIFDKNILLDSVLYGFAESKLVELPRDLLSKLTVLNNVGRLLAWCSDFVLDDTYNNLFANNSNVEWASGVFLGTKINSIPTNILTPLTKLVNASEMFATEQHLVSSEPWKDGKLDANDLNIPNGFLSNNTKLQHAGNMFAGRKSIKSYPDGLLDTNKSLVDARCMFMQTGITKIHEGTFDGFTTNIDVEYMFYGCRVRLCPKPIINSTGTFKTLGMLYRVSGLMTEEELFDGIKTNPADIQSMYRQELEYYTMDGTFSGDMYLKAIEPSSFPWDGYTLDIDPGDGNVITIEADIPNQDKLTELTRFTAKGNTIKVKAPFAIELAGGTATYTRLSGVFGRMATTSHIQFKNTGYKDSILTIDDDNFYKRNAHLTSLNNAFSGTQIEYFKTNGFKYLTKVTTIAQAFYSTPNFKIKDGYKPNFDHMKLTDISESFGSTLSLVVNKDWEPFKNIPTIVKANSVFNSSRIITTPYINTTSLTNIAHAYWMCPNLTTTYADILDGASKCSNFTGTFGHTPKLTIIEGATDNHTIADTAVTGVTGNVVYTNMFINTGLSQQEVVRIANNLGAWKVDSQMNVNTASMFENRANVNRNEVKTALKVSATNKIVHATHMFYNAKLTNVPNSAIVLTGNSSLQYDSMFYNCFASPDVEILGDVFSIPDQTPETDFRSSELDTLNVFRISVSPEQTANIMSRVDISPRSIVDNIDEIPDDDLSTNIGDSNITENIEYKQINSTNVSTNESIVDNIEEEIK